MASRWRWGKRGKDAASVISSGCYRADADTRQAGHRTCLAFSPAFGWDSAALYMLSGKGQNCRFSDGESRLTQEVLNQPPPLTGTNAWRGDPLLAQLSEAFAEPVRTELDQLGRFVRTAEAQDLARLANSAPPKLRTFDRQGQRLDQVEFHPAYHALMRRSVALGLHASVWENSNVEKGVRHQARAARYYLMSELETGHLCPITMTNASLAAIMASPTLFREWAPRVV